MRLNFYSEVSILVLLEAVLQPFLLAYTRWYRTVVSILVLLEAVLQLENQWGNVWIFVFQSLFCWKLFCNSIHPRAVVVVVPDAATGEVAGHGVRMAEGVRRPVYLDIFGRETEELLHVPPGVQQMPTQAFA